MLLAGTQYLDSMLTFDHLKVEMTKASMFCESEKFKIIKPSLLYLIYVRGIYNGRYWNVSTG